MNPVELQLETEALLATKLFIPSPRAAAVSRPRLISCLESGLTARVILISAPAGFGKTTILSSWLRPVRGEATGFPAAWVSLDERDNDPVRFWRYVVTALQRLQPGLGEDLLVRLQSAWPADSEPLLVALLNQMAELPPFVLVLDDYHLIQTLEIQQALAFWIDHFPVGAHLVLISRSDPPLPLPRWRVRGWLAELRAEDLRFTADEARAFLEGTMGLALAPAEVTALAGRTEGWIAGLHLAALSLRGRDDHAAFVRDFMGDDRYILDYLVEEVLERQPAAVQTFLLQTAVLDRLSAPLCDAVTGGGDSQAMLERLERDNLFLIPLDRRRVWYRYHHLFAELLQSRLRQNAPDSLPELYNRAAAWYEAEGEVDRAIEFWLSAGNFPAAVRLIEIYGLQALMRGEILTVHQWMEILPVEVWQASPRLILYRAWALTLGGQLELVEPVLALIWEHPDPGIRGEALSIRGHLARLQGDLQQSIDYSQQALALPGECPDDYRSVTALNLGLTYFMVGQVNESVAVLREAARLAESVGNMGMAVVSISQLGQSQEFMGHLHQAQESYRQALVWIERDARSSGPFAGLVFIGLARLALEWNDLPTALAYVQKGLEFGRRGGHVETLLNAYHTLAFIHKAMGDLEAALADLAAFDRFSWMASHPQAALLSDAHKAQIRVLQGRVEAAACWAEEARIVELLSSNQLQTRMYTDHLVLMLGTLWLAQGRRDRAGGFLERGAELLDFWMKRAISESRWGRWLEFAVLRVQIFHLLGELPAALSMLDRILELAEPEGYLTLFLGQGVPLAELLALRPENRYARRLAALVHPGTVGPKLIDPLTPRELEILELIIEGASNEEIARRLVLSVYTVKKHVSHLFDKLDVNSRTQAVARARALGL